MATIAELLQSAAALCRSNQVGPAEQIYLQILQIDAGHAEALGQLGRLAYHSGRPALAVDYLRRAAEAQPADADRRNILGVALMSQGRAGEAEAAYREAIRLRPNLAAAHVNLGNALRVQNRLADAESAYREAMRLRPDYAEAHNNLGVVLRAQDRLAEGETALREAIRCQPSFVEAHNNLGNTLRAQNRLPEAESAYREAVRLRPDHAEAHNNLGVVLGDQGRLAEAGLAFREAIRLRPDYAEAHNNLGVAWRDRDCLTEAEAAFREAVRLRPDFAEAYNNLGSALQEQNRVAEGESAYQEAVRLRPDLAEAHNNLAMLRLSQGRYPEGWAENEWRWRIIGRKPRRFDRPVWDGSRLCGTLLIYAEQGLGDTFHFIRYAALARERVSKVVFECQPVLTPVLSRCAGIDQLVPRAARGRHELPPFDAHVALMSLPRLLGTTVDTIPAPVPYLSADPDLVQHWRQEMAPLKKREDRGQKTEDREAAFLSSVFCPLSSVLIGINWQGNPRKDGPAINSYYRRRSFPLTALAPLARLPGVQFVVLQKGHGREQLTAAADWPLFDPNDRLDGPGRAFLDTAAVMQNLDLVITCDSAPLHLAGALGVPTWVALPFAPEWRWLLDRADSPWYPTLRLFRQTRPGDWAGVFERMAAALRERLSPRLSHIFA